MWGQALSGWERERMGAADDVIIPDWLTSPADRAKWLTLSDRDRSDWARAHGSAAGGSASVVAAEAAGQQSQAVQALEEAYSSLKASIPASVGYSTAPDRRWMLWAGGAVLVGYLVLRRGRRRKVARK